jgi:phytoene synthase
MTTSSPAIQPEQAQSQAAGSSFYAGMRVLPRAERDAMYAVYSFCREVDDIADDRGNTAQERAQKMAVWRHDIEQLYAGARRGWRPGWSARWRSLACVARISSP